MAVQATSQSIILTARDQDLLERFTALAAEKRVENPQAWVKYHMHQLATSPSASTGEPIAYVYDYAYQTRENAIKALPPEPGKDPGAVTDDHIRYAIQAVLDAEAAPTV